MGGSGLESDQDVFVCVFFFCVRFESAASATPLFPFFFGLLIYSLFLFRSLLTLISLRLSLVYSFVPSLFLPSDGIHSFILLLSFNDNCIHLTPHHLYNATCTTYIHMYLPYIPYLRPVTSLWNTKRIE